MITICLVTIITHTFAVIIIINKKLNDLSLLLKIIKNVLTS